MKTNEKVKTTILTVKTFYEDGINVAMNPITKELFIVPDGVKEKEFILLEETELFTSRGFENYDLFTDTYGATITIRESSSVEKRCWIFTKGGIRGNDGSIHIDDKMAKRIIQALQKFIDSSL